MWLPKPSWGSGGTAASRGRREVASRGRGVTVVSRGREATSRGRREVASRGIERGLLSPCSRGTGSYAPWVSTRNYTTISSCQVRAGGREGKALLQTGQDGSKAILCPSAHPPLPPQMEGEKGIILDFKNRVAHAS